SSTRSTTTLIMDIRQIISSLIQMHSQKFTNAFILYVSPDKNKVHMGSIEYHPVFWITYVEIITATEPKVSAKTCKNIPWKTIFLDDDEEEQLDWSMCFPH